MIAVLTLHLIEFEIFEQVSTVKRYPSFVKIVEVGPRDGLQNEKVSKAQPPLFTITKLMWNFPEIIDN